MSDGKLPQPITTYLELRDHFVDERPPGGGRQICVELTATLDAAVSELADGLSVNTVVVAVGGYGRGELSLGSDVDLMTVHVDRPDADAVASLLYPLWDAKLVVGHAARTLREIGSAGRDSIETLSALMTMRYVAGRRELFEESVDAVTKLVKQQSGRIAEVLQFEEAERRSEEPYWLLAADVKQGRGGLRTLHGVGLDRIRTGIVGESVDPIADVLLDVRNGLHAVTGHTVRKPSNRYTFEVREAVSAWLGDDSLEVGKRLQVARRSAEHLANQQFPRLGESPDPVAGVGRWLVRALRRSPSASYSSAFVQSAMVLDRSSGATFSMAEERAVRTAGPPLWSDDDRALFVRLLASGDQGRAIIERLHEFEWLAKAIPEWVESQDRPHVVAFHAYTVGGHHWATVDEILHLIDDDDPMLATVTDELGSVDDLLVAGFFHDVGKSRPGDHSKIGAEMVGDFARRAHFGATSQRRLGEAVRLHLLIPDAAAGRDIDDVGVIAEVAAQVGDVQLLRLLYLLSIADSRATGPNMLSAWKANLMRQLFQRVEEHLTGSPSQVDEATIVSAAGGAIGPQRVSSFLAALPAGYADRFSLEEIVRHLQITSPPPRPHEVRWNAQPLRSVTSLVMAAIDEPGLLVRVAGTLAAYGIEVLDARLVTTDNGIGIDTFHVQDALQGGPVAEGKLQTLFHDLTTNTDYRSRLEERRARYGSVAPGGHVTTYRDGRASVVEVRAVDRIGLLHDVCEVLTNCGVSIHLAKIRSRGDLAIDTLWLREAGSGEVLSDERLEATAARIGVWIADAGPTKAGESP